MCARKVLVADDDAHMTYMLSYKLRQRGVEVITAADGEEAYGMACEHVPDLILTDFQMPKFTGLELARRLRDHGPTSEIPLIMITARGHRAEDGELSQTNIKYLIAKPFSTLDLLAKVEEVLSQPESAATPVKAITQPTSHE